MELACDRALVSTNAEARSYAEGLYHVLSAVKHQRRLALANSLFARRTQIGQRIEVLLSGRIHSPQPKVAALPALLLVSTAGLSLGAQFTKGPMAADGAKPIVKQERPAGSAAPGPEVKTLRLNHVTVAYSGVHESYAKAIARTVSAAREIAVEQFEFDMPKMIHVKLKGCVPKPRRARQWSDGNARQASRQFRWRRLVDSCECRPTERRETIKMTVALGELSLADSSANPL